LALGVEDAERKADLDAPSRAGERFERRAALAGQLALAEDRAEPARCDQLGRRRVAEGVGESGIGLGERAAGEDGDRGRHAFEQRLQALRRQKEFMGFALVLRSALVLPLESSALERARDVFERLPVRVRLFGAPVQLEVGHMKRKRAHSSARRERLRSATAPMLTPSRGFPRLGKAKL
jgi:hypothetical protein